MKLIGSYLITEVDGEQFAVPVGAAAETVHGLIRLNDTGRDILQGLMDGKSEEEIAAGLHEKYADADMEKASNAVRSFVHSLHEKDLVEE